jgi:cyclopropane fatty-acyl-phospholipid synthase-like methyltransferase
VPAESLPAALLDAASEPYRRVGRFAFHFARGKLGGDPAYRALLEQGLLRGREALLDLGCGQGLLVAWLRAAQRLYAAGGWPGWPPPPTPTSIRGLELMSADVARACSALGVHCGVSQGDIRTSDFGRVDAVIILDVLHYMDDAAQRQVLARVHAALPKGGLLLLRVGDAAGGIRFRYSQWVDQTIMLLRGHSWVNTFCRPLDEWRALLSAVGFETQTVPMSQGTPFANVMLISTAR